MQIPSYLFLVGAPKCGTSSLAHWLKRQPGIGVSRIKEPCHFTDFGEHVWTGPGTASFDKPWVTDWDAYDALFPSGEDILWRVDASTDYLWNQTAADRIGAFAKDHAVKVAVILRDPVERAVSEHQHLLRDGYTQETLAEALDAEEGRRARYMHPLFYHVTRSRYFEAVSRYRSRFGKDLLILDYHHLKADPAAVLDQLARFIGVAPSTDVTLEVRNRGVVYKNSLLRNIIRSRRNVRFARRLVPKSLRSPIRTTVQGLATDRYRPSPDETAELRSRLAEDIAACRDDPRIPTDNWPLAFG